MLHQISARLLQTHQQKLVLLLLLLNMESVVFKRERNRTTARKRQFIFPVARSNIMLFQRCSSHNYVVLCRYTIVTLIFLAKNKERKEKSYSIVILKRGVSRKNKINLFDKFMKRGKEASVISCDLDIHRRSCKLYTRRTIFLF